MSSYDYIKQALVEKHGVQEAAITPEATLRDLGLDSLAIAELMFDVSDNYDIDIPDERSNINTMGEAVALVDEFIQAKSA